MLCLLLLFYFILFYFILFQNISISVTVNDSLLCNISEKVIQETTLLGSLTFQATITLEKFQFLGK